MKKVALRKKVNLSPKKNQNLKRVKASILLNQKNHLKNMKRRMRENLPQIGTI
jgi:hypothetical protein